MNIGFVSEGLPYLPARDGFRTHAANLIRCLSPDHAIDLLALEREGDRENLAWPTRFCRSFQTIRAGRQSVLSRAISVGAGYLRGTPLHYREEFRRALVGLRCDVLHAEGEFIGGLVAEYSDTPKVLAIHDSWTLRCEEMLKCRLHPKERAYYTFLKYYEPRYQRLVFPRFDACTVVAERDAQSIRRIVPEARIEVIPNGTDSDYFRKVAAPKAENTIVFHGNLGYGPNVEAAEELACRVLPILKTIHPKIQVRIVGAAPCERVRLLESIPSVTLLPDLADIRPAISAAQVYVCSIRHGSGIKNKLLEAMAMRLPVVAYRESVEGIDCIPGEHLCVADTREQLVSETLDLLSDPDRAGRLAAAGRRLVEERYSWRSRAQSYEALYNRLLSDRKERGRAARVPSKRYSLAEIS